MSTSAASSLRLASVKPAPAPASSELQAVRSQAAFLRALLDEVERLAPTSSAGEGMAEQVVEEIARLGCRSLEAAAELSRLMEMGRRCA